MQCPTKVPAIHPGRAKPRKFGLLNDFVRADVCAFRTSTKSAMLSLHARAKKTDKTWITGIVRDLNELPVPPPGPVSCPLDNGDFDLLRLYDGAGRVDVHVELDGCAFVVGPNGMDGIASAALRDALASVVA